MPPERPLTKKQRTILEAILFLMQKGEIPTVREVGALVGLRSPATVLKHLRVLENAGLISHSGKSRGIRIADPELLERALDAAVSDGAQDSAHDGGDELRPAEGDRSTVLQSHLPEVARWASSFAQSRPPSGASGNPGLKLFALRPMASPVPIVGAIAAGQPFESYADGFTSESFAEAVATAESPPPDTVSLGIDPRMFCDSGDVIALKVEGDSMIDAGILDGDYAIIRRQNSVEEGEIAAVIIDGEGTLKRWHTHRGAGSTTVSLRPENERFAPIEIDESEGRDVIVIGKYVGLVRGQLELA